MLWQRKRRKHLKKKSIFTTTVTAGTLAATTATNMGNGLHTLNNGTFQALGSATFTNDLAIGASGGTINTASGPTLSGAIPVLATH